MQEKKTIFCLCPPGDAIKLNLNNSNTKVNSPIANYLVTSGATILFVFGLRLFLHLLFLDPSMTKAYFFNIYFFIFCQLSVFLSVAQTTTSCQNILRHSEEKLTCSRHSDSRARAKN